MAALLVLACTACGPDEIPVGGIREPITRENLVAARERMEGGLLEPGWLPDGFALVNAEFDASGDRVWSVDLAYEAANGQYVHIFQTHFPAGQAGAQDPLALGEPIPGTAWNRRVVPAGQVGRPGVVEFSTRLDDGRTVLVDSDLDQETMLRILGSLVVRSEAAAGDH